jgi:PST family polysaccharide transporter
MFLIGGLRVQHDALLKRQMRFLSIAVRDVTSAALAVSVAIIMAVQGASYWAIVAMPLVGQFTQMALSWWLVRWWPGLPRRDAGIRSMLVFGGNVAASYAIHYVTHNADKVLIGRFSGATPLGLYSRAYNLLMLPVRQFMSPVTAVAVPAFSRLQDDEERFARYYLRIVSVMMWVCAPLFAFLGVAAEPVIVLAVGNQWRESVPVFQILAVSGLAELLLSSSTHWLLVSRGQSAKFLKLGLITAPLILGSFAMGLPFGIKGVALSYSSVVVVILPWALHFAFDGTHITLQRLGRVLMYPAMVSVLGVLSAKIAVYFTEPVGMLSKLLVIALGFAGAFLLSALIPRVREEVVSFRGLLSDLRRSNLPPRPGLVS